jgi:hypothetical protein
MVAVSTSTTNRLTLLIGKLIESLQPVIYNFTILKSDLMSIKILGASGFLGQGIKTRGQENQTQFTIWRPEDREVLRSSIVRTRELLMQKETD